MIGSSLYLTVLIDFVFFPHFYKVLWEFLVLQATMAMNLHSPSDLQNGPETCCHLSELCDIHMER
jgi:hypothetical protein